MPEAQPADPKVTEQSQLEKMQVSPRVWGDTDFTELEENEAELDETKIFWMGTNANMGDTPQEQLEHRLAILDQIKKGILDKYGYPVGFTFDELGIPKDKQEEILKARAEAESKAAPVQSIPQYQNRPMEKKVYKNKYERKMDRERMRVEMKKQEKLARANEMIRKHQSLNIPTK